MSYYNTKIIRTSSYVEIYEYSKPISKKTKKENSITLINNTNEITDKTNDKSKRNEEDSIRRMALTRKRSKAELVRLIDTNCDNRTSFLTLTVKENIINRNTFSTMFDKFITRMNYNFLNTKQRKLKYIAVLEKQKRGAYHVHMLIFDIGFLKHSELMKVWGHGGVRINKLNSLDDSSNAGRYVSKYMEKSIGQELLESKGKKSYYCSHNLNKPVVSTLLLNHDDIIALTNSENVSYSSEYKSKVYRDGEFIENLVKYKKIKLDMEEEQ